MDHSFPLAGLLVPLLVRVLFSGEPMPSGCLVGVALKWTCVGKEKGGITLQVNNYM